VILPKVVLAGVWRFDIVADNPATH
jgi:hypothetical protein